MGEWDLPLIWAGIIGIAVALYVILDGFDLGVGILFPFSRDEKERDQMIGIDRAVLGRQRDLAGARRRRIVGRVPARLWRDHVGALSAGDRDAAGAGVPRCRIRIPHRGRDQQALLEFCVRRRLRARRDLPGRDPRRADPGHRRQRRRLRRRRVRLGDAVRADVRARRARRLWPARRHLAGDEDRRRGRRARQAARQAAAARACSASWRS